MLSQYDPLQGSGPILSRQSARGLILATGTLNSTLVAEDEFDMFVSRDGGLSWSETLKVY